MFNLPSMLYSDFEKLKVCLRLGNVSALFSEMSSSVEGYKHIKLLLLNTLVS